ncbi:MAG: hypothetical protein OXI25_05000 [Chloroflexota bacterium]|nr:hypothetical protein [Chloroflexota bacterium]
MRAASLGRRAGEGAIDRITPNRWLWGAGVGVAVLALAAVIVALTVNRGVDALDPDTPEGVVQRYLQAIAGGEYEDAYGFLSDEAQADCAADGFIESLDRRGYYREIRFSARLTDVRMRGDSATVRVRIEERYERGGLAYAPLYEPRSGYVEPYRLDRTDAGWRLAEPGYPVWSCPSPPEPKPIREVEA